MQGKAGQNRARKCRAGARMAGVLWQPSRLREVMGAVERLLPQVMATVQASHYFRYWY